MYKTQSNSTIKGMAAADVLEAGFACFGPRHILNYSVGQGSFCF